jgi:hypothetical protein
VKRMFMVEGAAAFPTKAEFINALYAAGASSVTELDLDAVKREARLEEREVITRVFSMPSSATFSIKPIAALLDRWLVGCAVVVDPFAGDSMRGTLRNDIRNGGVDALVYLNKLSDDGIVADAVLLDPPYSPRQMKEMYESAGIANSGIESTQNGRLYRECIELLDRLLKPGGIAVRCGWNSMGFPPSTYTRLETLLVNHGGAHNDTIVTVDRKCAQQLLPGSRLIAAAEDGGKK